MNQNQGAGVQGSGNNLLGGLYTPPSAPSGAGTVDLRKWAVEQAAIVAPSRDVRSFLKTADAIRAFALTGAVPE